MESLETTDTLDTYLAQENRRYIATHVLSALVGNGAFDSTNNSHVSSTAAFAVKYADALILELGK